MGFAAKKSGSRRINVRCKAERLSWQFPNRQIGWNRFMKNKAAFWQVLLPLLAVLIWFMGSSSSYARQEDIHQASQPGGLQSYLSAKATSTISHSITPTPLPAIYGVEQTHPAMIAGASVLVLIIVVGVLAFSRHKA
jgi:hypothetical protein